MKSNQNKFKFDICFVKQLQIPGVFKKKVRLRICEHSRSRRQRLSLLHKPQETTCVEESEELKTSVQNAFCEWNGMEWKEQY